MSENNLKIKIVEIMGMRTSITNFSTLSHIKDGKVKMVDISNKIVTKRTARAKATVTFPSKNIFDTVQSTPNEKGNIFSVCKIAGIQAAKKTCDLIPLCHQINLSSIEVNLKWDFENLKVEIESLVKTESQTGVEMEALTACSVASLCFIDMCKALTPDLTFKVQLVEKTK